MNGYQQTFTTHRLLLPMPCMHTSLLVTMKGKKMRRTIIGRHLLNVTVALGSLSLIEQGHDEFEPVMLQPILERPTKLL